MGQREAEDRSCVPVRAFGRGEEAGERDVGVGVQAGVAGCGAEVEESVVEGEERGQAGLEGGGRCGGWGGDAEG